MAYSVADPYNAAIRDGLALTYTVDASYAGSPVVGATGLVPIGGQVTDTTKPGVRRVLNLELAPARGLFDALAPIGTRLTVTAHVRYTNRTTDTVPMGVFDVDEQTLTEGGGKLSLTAPDKWQQIVRARFVNPTASTPGSTVTAQITALIRGALGSSEPVTVTATSTATVGALTWDRDRDQAIIDLANGIGAWVFFDRNGTATIADVPKTASTANWSINAGSAGVLVSLDRTRSRTSTYNLVVVNSSKSDGAAFATQYVWDTDSSSPTYVAAGPWGTTPPTSTTNPFGIVPYFFDTPLALTAAGAIDAGAAVLYKTTGRASAITATSTHNPAIDAFDAIDVTGPKTFIGVTPSTERHVVDTVTHPLDITQPLRIDGRSTRTDAYT